MPSTGEKEREKTKKRKSRLARALKSLRLLNLVRIKGFLFNAIIHLLQKSKCYHGFIMKHYNK
jgi:hypothetical protein